MVLLRVVVERLLAILFGLTASVMIFQGLSILPALLVVRAVPGLEAHPAWLTGVITRGVMIAATFVAGGAVLGLLRARLARGQGPAAAAGAEGHDRLVLAALVPTLALPAVALAMSWSLFGLVRELLIGMDRLGVGTALARGADPFAGMVLLPVAAVLFAPALQLASTLFLVAVPPFLLVLLLTRSPRFGNYGALTFGAQATFVLAALAGTDLIARIADLLIPILRTEGGAEAAPWLPLLTTMRATLVTTAWRHVALLGVSGACLGGLALLRRSGVSELEEASHPAEAGLETLDDPTAEPPAPALPFDSGEAERPAKTTPRPATGPPGPVYSSVSDLPAISRQALDQALALFRTRQGETAGRELPEPATAVPVSTAPAPWTAPPGGPARPGLAGSRALRSISRVLLGGMGGLMLFSGACQLAWPRAHFVDSSPAAGGDLPRPPARIEVRFDHALDPASTIRVQCARRADGTPDGSGEPLHRDSRLDAGDPEGRTLVAHLSPELGVGVYRVDWQAMTAGGGGARSGWFYFGVGRDVPSDLAAAAGRPYQERDAGARGVRASLLAGIALLALALFLPQPAARR